MYSANPGRTIVVSAAFIMLLCATFSNCKDKEEPPTAQEQVTEMIVSAKAWSKPIVIVDGVDVSETYKNFSISFKEKTYSSTGGAPMWAANGKWVFTNDKATTMILDDTVEVDIAVTARQLKLSRLWEYETFEPGRSKSVKGKHEFTLEQ